MKISKLKVEKVGLISLIIWLALNATSAYAQGPPINLSNGQNYGSNIKMATLGYDVTINVASGTASLTLNGANSYQRTDIRRQ